MREELAVVGERSGRGSGRDAAREERIAALGRALSDPIRVRMLWLMAETITTGRSCCDLPERGVPATEDENIGICVCEFEEYFGMGQSKISYHVRKLKEAGLVREEKRGKWSFYSLDQEAVRGLLGEAARQLGAATERVEQI